MAEKSAPCLAGVGKDVFTEYQKRMDDEHERISHRLSTLEETVKQIGELTSSVKELAVNMGTMAKTLSDQNERLKAIESRDGEMWRDIVSKAIMCVVTGVIGYFLAKFI